MRDLVKEFLEKPTNIKKKKKKKNKKKGGRKGSKEMESVR